jgi:hypothetical protein
MKGEIWRAYVDKRQAKDIVAAGKYALSHSPKRFMKVLTVTWDEMEESWRVRLGTKE